MSTPLVRPAKGCTVEGCARPHTARGLCKVHYNQQHETRATMTVACDVCGTAIIREKRHGRKYSYNRCSELCRQWREFGPWASKLPASHKALAPKRRANRKARPAKVAKQSKRTFKTGQCQMCSAWFTCLYGSKTCSAACQAQSRRHSKSEAKLRRRARQHLAFVAPVSRRQVYARDLNHCQLCGKPMDMQAQVPAPMSPTIDHIVALARGGTHEPANVQSAHFICNALKGDRVNVPSFLSGRSLAA